MHNRRPMLNISCHITDPLGQSLRYTVKTEPDGSVQQLVDRIQARFQQPLSQVKRNDRINNEPAHVLFFDEPVEPGDEFYFSFEPFASQLAKQTPPRESSVPVSESAALAPLPTCSSLMPLLTSAALLPLPLPAPLHGSSVPPKPGTPGPQKHSPLMPVLVEELQTVPLSIASLDNGRAGPASAAPPAPPHVVPLPQPLPLPLEQSHSAGDSPTHLTSSLATMTVERVLQGCRKAEVIYDKLKRAESILPAERQLLVRTAGRWLMDCCATRMKPTSAERAYFAREFFGKLPNFKYDIVSGAAHSQTRFQRDFHNSQSRGFLDVFIYNERDRKSRAGELNRPFIPTESLVKTMKRKFNKISDGSAIKDENNGPFPQELSVPGETVASLQYLDEDLLSFEARYQDIISKEFAAPPGESMANRWENVIAPKIIAYVQRLNCDFYNKAAEGVPDRDHNHALIALKLIPFLVRRVYKDNSKLSYLIVKVDVLEDSDMLQSMRERHDAGPVIFTDNASYRIVVMDRMIRCEQSAAQALEKLLKAFYVYSLPLSPMRRTLILFILTFFGISRKATSAFKETVNCIMSLP